MSEQILIDVTGAVMTVRMNRPEKKNALTRAMYTEMTTALRRADEDAAVRVVLLRGTDDCFTSGNDIVDFMQAPPTDETSPAFQFLRAVVAAKKPLVAAVTGPAVGIGTTMLLHCDLVYAGASARLHLPFINLALVPEGGSSLLLPQMLGHVRAAELLMLGEPFDAPTAQRYGIVNAVLPDEEVQAKALAAAQALAAKPPAAVQTTKAMLKRDQQAALDATIAYEAGLFAQRLQSPEAAEAFQAFMERRKPDFSKF